MQDYLNQLVNRIQQAAFTVQPRPISRFESPRHMAAGYSECFESHKESPELFNPLESATASESDESSALLPSPNRLATEIGADEPVQPIESNNRHESGKINALLRDSPAAESSFISHMSRSVFTHQPVRGTDPIDTSNGQPTGLGEQSVQTEQSTQTGSTIQVAAEPTQSVMRKESSIEKAILSLNDPLPEQREHSEDTEYVTRRRQEERIKPDARLNTIARRSADTSSSIVDLSIYPLGRHEEQQTLSEPNESITQERQERQERRAQHQPNTVLNKPVAMPSAITADSLSACPQPAAQNQFHIQTAKESTHPFIPPVRVENPESKPISPDSAPVTVAHRAGLVNKVSAQIEPLPERRSDSIVRPHFSPASERAIFKQPFAEPDALQHAAEQVVNTPAPTIQVTIGRIEVRAVVAATPAPAPARKAPAISSTMSLDDYLRQRSGRSQ